MNVCVYVLYLKLYVMYLYFFFYRMGFEYLFINNLLFVVLYYY